MARKPYPSETAEKLLIRFPEGMREKIAESAKAANRSMNAEVIARLERTFAESADLDGFDVKQEVQRHHAWMVMMMEILAKSDDETFAPIRDVLSDMDSAGRKTAAKWFLENEKPEG